MATLNGFKLTLPNGDVYSGKGNLRIAHQTMGNFLIGGQGGGGLLETPATYLGEWAEGGGATGYADGLNQNIAVLQHGTRTVEIGFTKWEGETGESWGGIVDSADAIQKMQALDDALNQVRIDSTAVADLEVGEYHTNGTYDPLPVGLAESNLVFESAEQSSSFRGTVTFFELTSLTETIDTVSP